MGRREQDGPRRTCIGCRAVRAQAELIRLAATADGNVTVAPGAPTGRGAYLCPAADCLERAVKRRGLPQALRRPLPLLETQALRRAFASALAAREAGERQTDREVAKREHGQAAV